SYRETLDVVRHLASGLIARGLDAERPLVILSGNSVDHALLGLAALYAGVPYCPVSPAYSLVSSDHGKLKYVNSLLTPGLIYADSLDAYGKAIVSAFPPDIEVVGSSGSLPDRAVTTFADLAATPVAENLDEIHDSIGPDSIAKFLLTSGSTGMPKAVINTQRMICANQVMIRDTLAFIKGEPPVLLDWLPWNHTFGGNHNVGLVIYNGGSLYIDDGKPVPGGIEKTVRNLMEVSPTCYFNVPKGYEMLLVHLRANADLRKAFFRQLHGMFFAGASLAAHVWQGLDEVGEEETGHRVPMLTGLGSTETAPFCMSVLPETSRSGHVGLPVPGNEIKLVPNGGKLELRVRGPNITPGYWRQPDLTEKAFDEEGFYKLGDALKPVDPDDFTKGFDFDGRISEDFKLASGTWVSVGPLRARFIAGMAPLVRDVVIAGLNRDDLAAIAILDPDGCAAALPHLAGTNDPAVLAADPALRKLSAEKLAALAATSTGSATRIMRLALLESPPSIDRGEITDKGSINQRAVLEHRAGMVDDLYAATPSSKIISLSGPSA
ncbi:MAG: feruloyl-CoA synthase, partial [Proteobacteria bacterium]|nr:feruloyl-CoA synthase [Pseudomonadota bacterium]